MSDTVINMPDGSKWSPSTSTDVLKLGGNVVKGNFGSSSSWNSGQQTSPAVATFFSNLIHTRMVTLMFQNVETLVIVTGLANVQNPTFAQNTYDNSNSNIDFLTSI